MSLEHSPARTGRGLLTEGDVCGRLRISRVTLWRWVRTGQFPEPIYPGPHTKRWTEEMYDNYIAGLVAALERRVVDMTTAQT